MDGRKYTSNLQHGGALLEDMRVLVQHWSKNASWNEQKQKTTLENILGKKSKKRLLNILDSIFAPRFIKGNPPEAWKIIRSLEDKNISIEVLRPVYYWVSCRSEPVLYDYVQDEIFSKSRGLDLVVRMNETIQWLEKKVKENKLEWSDSVTKRVAWGILAALRDFGILEGTKNKKIAPVYIPIEAFAYLAFVLHHLNYSGERLVNHPDWKLFLVDRLVVERLFLEAHQERLLQFASAGNIYRIEFPTKSWSDMADVITGRTI